ncbi:arsenite methyltransferase [Aurantibacter sp.]|uniref:arsenite methyltransferase n=1 Tax=Aurantibacter sp. TaxID=2807103 RepID=UPI003265AC95
MEKSVKESVVESYGKLAKSTKKGLTSKLFACCDPNENAYEVGKTIGYSEEILNAVPKGSNLGVGCGNPSALADIHKGETVIDLGSGAGFDAFIVSPIVGSNGKVIGVDLSDEMLELAKENVEKGNYSNVDFIKGDIEKLPLDNNIAEHVVSNCVINLSLNKGDVFKEAYRVLKNEGSLTISDIVLKKELPAFIKNSLSGHIACVSGAEKVEDYLQYLNDAGFKDIKIESKAEFPIELMLADPQVMKLANEMNFKLDSEEAKDIVSSVVSISLSAKK